MNKQGILGYNDKIVQHILEGESRVFYSTIVMKNKLILISSNQLGKGSPELGETILETFFTLLKQQTEKPAAIFCMNSGVFTLTDQSLLSLQLKELECQGVPILACKTCTDYYGISDQITVGELSGMKKFIELANQYEVLTLS